MNAMEKNVTIVAENPIKRYEQWLKDNPKARVLLKRVRNGYVETIYVEE